MYVLFICIYVFTFMFPVIYVYCSIGSTYGYRLCIYNVFSMYTLCIMCLLCVYYVYIIRILDDSIF